MDLFTNFLKMMDLSAGSALAESYLNNERIEDERSIVPGSMQWYTEDASSVQMNGRPINVTSNTRVRFGPCQMCTHPSLNIIEWSITLDPRQWLIQFGNITDDTNVFAPLTFNTTAGNLRAAANTVGHIIAGQSLNFWVGFPHSSAFATQRILLPANAGNSKTTLDYAAQEALLSMLSIPKLTLSHNEGFLGIEELLIGGDPGCGTIVNLPFSHILRTAVAGDGDTASVALTGNAQRFYWDGVNPNSTLTINGIIDLNFLDPLYSDFPIMTPQWNNTFLQFNMNRVLQNLQVIQLNQKSAHGFYPIIGSLPPDKPQAISIIREKAGTAVLTAATTASFDVANDTYDNTLKNKTKDVTITPAVTTIYPYDVSRLLVRFVNASHWNQAAPIAPAVYNPCWNISGKWNRFRTQQILFQLEDQESIVAALTKRGELITPVKHFTSYTFNGVSYDSSMITTGISSENIDKIYIQIPYLLEYPLCLPHPLLKNINPTFKRVLFNNPDEYINQQARHKIMECFIDTDKASPSRNLYDSLHFKNLNTGSSEYGTINLWSQNGGITRTPLQSQTYFPNQFVYAVDLGRGNEFRGANSKMPGSVSSYNSSESFRLTSSSDSDVTIGGPVTATKHEFQEWITYAGFGKVTRANGNSICTTLSFGKMLTTFNKATGMVEKIIVE